MEWKLEPVEVEPQDVLRSHVTMSENVVDGDSIHGINLCSPVTFQLTNIEDTSQVIVSNDSASEGIPNNSTFDITHIKKELPNQGVDIPDVVASETVVTMTPPRIVTYSNDAALKGSPMCVKIFSPDHKVESSLLEQLEEVGVWSELRTCGKILGADNPSESDLNTSQESFIALAPNTIAPPLGQPVAQPNKTQNTSVRENVRMERERIKRDRDRAKKRELRLNPIFREKEKEKAKVRMRNKRSDPNYRNAERTKDRIRRRISRRRTALQRKEERDASDLEYQKILDTMAGKGNVVVQKDQDREPILVTEDGHLAGELGDETVLHGMDTSTYIVIDSSTRHLLEL